MICRSGRHGEHSGGAASLVSHRVSSSTSIRDTCAAFERTAGFLSNETSRRKLGADLAQRALLARTRRSKARLEPIPETQWSDNVKEALREIKVRQGEVPNIFKTLAHHPDLMRRWLVFGNHVLFK
jgi:hypothetical protein